MSYPNEHYDTWLTAFNSAFHWAQIYGQRYSVWRARDGQWVASPQFPLDHNILPRVKVGIGIP